MKESISIYLAIIILFFLGIYVGFLNGKEKEKNDFIKRAKQLPQKECYTNQDLEYILFNEIQL